MTTETTLQTIQDFLVKYPVSIQLVEVPENPQMDNSKDQMINYYVTLGYEGRIMSVYFSTGPGWVESMSGKSVYGITYRKRDKVFIKQGQVIYEPFTFSKYRIRKPKVEDVLDCLASDCNGIEQPFEDWASGLGYDTDSRKAYDTYQTIQRQTRELRRMLGNAAFDELVNQTERI